MGVVNHAGNKFVKYCQDQNYKLVSRTGFNAGLGLINLNRIRRRLKNWNKVILNPLHESPNKFVEYCDQTLLNIYFGKNPKQLFHLPCNWNFKPRVCVNCGKFLCRNLVSTGVCGLHSLHADLSDSSLEIQLSKVFSSTVIASKGYRKSLTKNVKHYLKKASKEKNPCSRCFGTVNFSRDVLFKNLLKHLDIYDDIL